MFEPEIFFCSQIDIPDIKPFPHTDYIGSNVVRNTSFEKIDLKSAARFLNMVKESVLDKSSRDYNRTYYYPYFANYFVGLQRAYQNISHYLDGDFRGFIIVQDNHFRDIEVPVAKCVLEIWKNLGFKTEIRSRNEVFHTGTLNPRSKGLKAKQVQYVLEIRK
jgi:hypothetical protein